MRRRERIYYLFEIIILIFGIGLLFYQKSRSNPIDLSMSQWVSNQIEQNPDGSWEVDTAQVDMRNREQITLMGGPYVDLKRGTYTIDIQYECNKAQDVILYANDGGSYYIKANTIVLDKNKTDIQYDFSLSNDVKALEMLVKYDGEGHLKINNVAIQRNTSDIKRGLVLLFIFFGAFNLIFHYWEKISKNKDISAILCGAVLCASLPLFLSGFHTELGMDLPFHLMRIEGIAEELRYGQFPVRMSSLWIGGYGYPVSIYYGDALLYFPAILRLAGFTVTEALKWYIFFVNVGTVGISFAVFNKIFGNKRIAAVLALVYVTTPYRMANIYTRSALGEYTALLFLPIILLAVYNIYRVEYRGARAYLKNSLLLAIGMTGIIGTHVLSTEITCVVLVIVCVLCARKTFRKKALITYGMAVFETLILSAYFIVPMLDYYLNERVFINETVNSGNAQIQQYGVTVAQFFAFFQSPFKTYVGDSARQIIYTPGIVLIASLIVGLYWWWNHRVQKEIKFFSLLSLVILFISSNLFPWDFLAAHTKVGNILAQVQGPSRYLESGCLSLVLLLGYMLLEKDFHGKAVRIVCILCVASSSLFVSQYFKEADLQTVYDGSELNTYYAANAEYMKCGTDWSYPPLMVEAYGMDYAEITEVKGCKIRLSCKAAGYDNGYVDIARTCYRGYKAFDDQGNEYAVYPSGRGWITVELPYTFEGEINIDYYVPWYWRGAEVVSLLGFAVLLIWLKLDKKFRRKFTARR